MGPIQKIKERTFRRHDSFNIREIIKITKSDEDENG